MLESGIEKSFILNEDEAIVLQAEEGFKDETFGKGFMISSYLFIYQYSFARSFIHSFIHIFTSLFVYLYLFIHYSDIYFYLFIYLFIYLFLLIYSYIHLIGNLFIFSNVGAPTKSLDLLIGLWFPA